MTHSVACYKTHPPFEVAPGLVMYGGTCLTPFVKDADIYVGLDNGMELTKRRFPWNPGHEILFPITNMAAPKNPDEFRKMVEWLSDQIMHGAKVHAGCIAGHGRTGMLLAAIRKHLSNDDMAAFAVREKYCKSAIETPEQIEFLEKHWGLKPVTPRYGKGGSSLKQFDWNESSQSSQVTLPFKSSTSRQDDMRWDVGQHKFVERNPQPKQSAFEFTAHPDMEASIWGS